MARNRVIYQSEALFVNHHTSGFNTVDIVAGDTVGSPGQAQPGINSSMFHQIARVQSANYSFSINRTDVNQFGNLARIDTAVIEAPTVSLDFSYLLTDGSNEDKLGISVDPSNSGAALGTPDGIAAHVQVSCISGMLANTSGRNYHILTTSEGTDANANSGSSTGEGSTVISIGNGFITNYSMEASVGSIPTASVSVEGLNIRSDNAGEELTVPSIDPEAGTAGTGTYTLPDPVTGDVGDVLRPGDVELTLGNPALMSNLSDSASANSAHIQSFNIGLPMGRSNLQRLGSSFGFSREVDFPVQVSIGLSAIVADLRDGQSLFTELYAQNKHDLVFTLRKPNSEGAKKGDPQVAFIIKNAVLESESFSNSIGDNKSVDLSFTATVGGPEDITNGLFISGTRCGEESIRDSR